MTRVGNVEQILLLLREQLQRSARARPARSAAAQRADPASPRPIDRACALTALDALSEEDQRRAVVRGLLAEELGDAIGNDAAFQQVIDEVVRIIADMPGGDELMARAVEQLRAG